MLQTSVVRWTAALIALLLVAGSAQAMGDLRDSLEDTAMEAERTVAELRGDLEEKAEQVSGDAGEDAESIAYQTQDRAQQTVDDARGLASPEVLVETLHREVLQPVDQTLGDLQRQADGLLAEEETPDETTPEPTMSTASVGAWPVFETPVLLLAGTALGLGFLLWFFGQSATVGAGAAGTAALRDGRRFIPFASPLFTRFEKDTVLGHPKREAIYGSIISNPGVTLQDLCEETGLSRTAVTHHLRLMEQQHLIVSKRVGRSRHFFENGGRYGRHQKDAYAVLHNERTKEIHDFIQANPGAIQKDLCTQFGIQPSVAHWHVKRLLEADLVESMRQGRTVSYFSAQQVAPAPKPEAAPVAAPAVA